MYAVLQVTPELNAGGVERTTIEMAEAITRKLGENGIEIRPLGRVQQMIS